MSICCASDLPGRPARRCWTEFVFIAWDRAYQALNATNEYDIVVEDLNKIPLYIPRWKPRNLVVMTHHLFGTTAFREESLPVAAATWLAERPLGRGYRGVEFQRIASRSYTTASTWNRSLPIRTRVRKRRYSRILVG